MAQPHQPYVVTRSVNTDDGPIGVPSGASRVASTADHTGTGRVRGHPGDVLALAVDRDVLVRARSASTPGWRAVEIGRSRSPVCRARSSP